MHMAQPTMVACVCNHGGYNNADAICLRPQAKKWCERLKIPYDERLVKHRLLCPDHFDPNDYMANRRLQVSAVPLAFIGPENRNFNKQFEFKVVVKHETLKADVVVEPPSKTSKVEQEPKNPAVILKNKRIQPVPKNYFKSQLSPAVKARRKAAKKEFDAQVEASAASQEPESKLRRRKGPTIITGSGRTIPPDLISKCPEKTVISDSVNTTSSSINDSLSATRNGSTSATKTNPPRKLRGLIKIVNRPVVKMDKGSQSPFKPKLPKSALQKSATKPIQLAMKDIKSDTQATINGEHFSAADDYAAEEMAKGVAAIPFSRLNKRKVIKYPKGVHPARAKVVVSNKSRVYRTEAQKKMIKSETTGQLEEVTRFVVMAPVKKRYTSIIPPKNNHAAPSISAQRRMQLQAALINAQKRIVKTD